MPRALVIEDERELARLVDYHLRRAGFEVEVAGTGSEGLARAAEAPPQLIVLDVRLPDIDGFEVCARLRATPATQTVGVLMLTANGLAEDRVEGFARGADDYMTKPFSGRELVLRASAVARRVPSGTSPPAVASTALRSGVIELDRDTLEVRVGGAVVDLRPTEVRLLRVFLEAPGKTYSRKDLLAQVWGVRGPANQRIVDVAMHRLRTGLGEGGAAIETVLEGGYRLRDDGAAQ
jgi:two-component system, OmpR family, phosphate regulon response regulator PhoB